MLWESSQYKHCLAYFASYFDYVVMRRGQEVKSLRALRGGGGQKAYESVLGGGGGQAISYVRFLKKIEDLIKIMIFH